MQRELELKIELSPSNIARLEGGLSAADLVIGPATHKKLRSFFQATRVSRLRSGRRHTLRIIFHDAR